MLQYLILILVVLFSGLANAEGASVKASDLALPDIESITVNGLIAGKAVVVIDGQSYIMRAGQRVRGVKLLSADSFSAELMIGERRKRFYLHEEKLEHYSDDFIVETDTASTEQKQILASEALVKAKTHILNIKPIKQTDDRVTFRIEYFYNASHGENISLRGSTYFKGKPTGFSAHAYTKLYSGRNLVDIDIFMNKDAPEKYLSDVIRFEMIGGKKVDGSSRVLAKHSPFEKYWSRQKEVQFEPTLSNAEWKVISQ